MEPRQPPQHRHHPHTNPRLGTHLPFIPQRPLSSFHPLRLWVCVHNCVLINADSDHLRGWYCQFGESIKWRGELGCAQVRSGSFGDRFDYYVCDGSAEYCYGRENTNLYYSIYLKCWTSFYWLVHLLRLLVHQRPGCHPGIGLYHQVRSNPQNENLPHPTTYLMDLFTLSSIHPYPISRPINLFINFSLTLTNSGMFQWRPRWIYMFGVWHLQDYYSGDYC